MESMDMENWFGELIESCSELGKYARDVYSGEIRSGEELDPNIDFAEMDKLERMLVEADIPYEKERMFGGKHLIYPRKGDDQVCSVILHKGSYGRHNGLLEIMGLLTDKELECDTVVGHLTADDVFGRIKKHWEERRITGGAV